MRLAVAIGLTTAVASLVSGADAAPTPLTLRFEGAHVPDSSLPAGVRHDGRFTASPPLCPSGHASDTRDVVVEPLTVLRTHVCDDGSGSFTALLPLARNEHGGTGTWKIVEGTGRYETLRGVGTYTGTLISGDPARFETIVYRTEWQGVIDFDAVGPMVAISASTKKLKRPARTYTIRIALDAHESMSYTLAVKAGRSNLAYETGSTASGRATHKVRIQAPRSVRMVTISVITSDAVGNESTTTRSLRLK